VTTVFVDAENVRRSQWPNLSPEGLVERSCRWAKEHGLRALIVFDGRAPAFDGNESCEVVGTGDEIADDWIARTASDEDDYWLVTSDRELRERAGGRAERVIGGGAFLRQLSETR
jgi:uncharacterized protein YaiI (UPF0178 family)